jgi:hypothetical protein
LPAHFYLSDALLITQPLKKTKQGRLTMSGLRHSMISMLLVDAVVYALFIGIVSLLMYAIIQSDIQN